MLRLDVNFISDADRWWRKAVPVCRELIAILRGLNLILEHRMQFVEVNSVTARSVIVGEFGEREKFGPIVLLIIAVDTNVLL